MISCIIPYRSRDNSLVSLKYVLSQLKDAVDIIIVEDSDKQTLAKTFSDARITTLFQYNLGLFEKSRAINYGVTHAKYDNLILQDADSFFNQSYIGEINKHLLSLEAVHLGKQVRWLTEASTNAVLAGSISPSNAEFFQQNQTFKGGSIGIRKDAFLKIGGMNESFLGHGGEDTSFYELVTTLNFERIPTFVLYHLYHKRGAGHQNKDVRREESKLSKEQRIILNKQSFKNKYGLL